MIYISFFRDLQNNKIGSIDDTAFIGLDNLTEL